MWELASHRKESRAFPIQRYKTLDNEWKGFDRMEHIDKLIQSAELCVWISSERKTYIFLYCLELSE